MITSRLTDAYHKRNLLNDIRSEVYGEVKKLDKDIFRMEETKISLFPNWRHHRPYIKKIVILLDGLELKIL